jgi:hypothetical protein
LLLTQLVLLLLQQTLRLPATAFAGALCWSSGLCCRCKRKFLLHVFCKVLQGWWLYLSRKVLLLLHLFSPCLLLLQLGNLLCMKLCDLCRVQHI